MHAHGTAPRVKTSFQHWSYFQLVLQGLGSLTKLPTYFYSCPLLVPASLWDPWPVITPALSDLSSSLEPDLGSLSLHPAT